MSNLNVLRFLEGHLRIFRSLGPKDFLWFLLLTYNKLMDMDPVLILNKRPSQVLCDNRQRHCEHCNATFLEYHHTKFSTEVI